MSGCYDSSISTLNALLSARYPYPTGRQQRILESSSSFAQTAAHPADASQNISTAEIRTPTLPSSIDSSGLSLSSETDPQRHIVRHPSPSIPQQDDIESQQFLRPRIDWKLLTKIGTNWETGTAAQYSLSPSPSPAPGLTERSPANVTPTKASRHPTREPMDAHRRISAHGFSSSHREGNQEGRHLLKLSPSFIFVAYPDSPLLHVHSSQSDVETHQDQGKQNPPLALIPPPPGWSSPSRPDYITCITVDSNDMMAEASTSTRREPVRLVLFYQSGGFVVLSVKLDSTSTTAGRQPRVTWTRLVVYEPTDVSRRARRSAYTRRSGDPTVLCELDSPVLVSCTERFYISVWRLPDFATDAATHRLPVLLQTLHSPVSFHPATLRLKHLPRQDSAKVNIEDAWKESESRCVSEAYRASLAYSVPLYPERWTLAVQDIDITLPLNDPSGDVECGECFHVAKSIMPGAKSLRNRWPLLPRSEIIGVKGDRAIGIGLGDTCCVLAGSDNQIQVYQLPDRSASLEPDTVAAGGRWEPPHMASTTRREIRHVQTLLAHSSAITAIALDLGRCVSAGNDGRILVWQVDRAAEVLPAEGSEFEAEEAEPQGEGWVTVRPTLSGKSAEYGASSPAWSHVEVRTPRKTTSANENSCRQRNANPPSTSSARSIVPSASTSLHQQFLPVPPVTHPLSLASAAREYLISPRTGKVAADSADYRAQEEERASRIVEQLAFNEDRIVGLVRSREKRVAARGEGGSSGHSVIKVWTFDA